MEDEVQDTAASQKQSKEHPYPLFNIDSNEQKAFMADVNNNQVPVSMEYDTGVAITLITKKMYERIRQRNHMEPLQESDAQLPTYTRQLVPLLGTTSVNVECGEKQDVLLVLVVEGEGSNILGRDLITAFKAFKVDFGQIDNLVGSNQLQVLLEKHSSVFNNKIGTLKGIKVKLHVDPNVKLKFFKARSVPYSLREKVETELGRLENSGIISPVQFCLIGLHL